MSLVSPVISLPDELSQKSVKLGIMASGSGTNFEAVAQAIADKQLNAEIKVLIYNNPQAKVKSRAEKWQVPSVLINHREYRQREALDQKIVNTLQEYDVQWVVMAGWMRIVTKVLLDNFPDRIINIHPSLLPSFKGINAIEQAFRAQVKITGCTVHLVNLEVDSGQIIMQAAVPILSDDTLETLHARIQVQEHLILPQAISLAVNNCPDN
ncbi:phosphoribosylglycinamide formyltransferase, formyltetrahydrofolate-dependent [Xenococcus sp. PCC 7305]|uniref:phosphoribosylglycinamide formyltransferase n=1 Tax=Xenococcus sp. PCC 7305 TaxID=102125 RepID=UPI0002AC027C|nr:phosphoribosylglycinamide formyltransferase [Xenococcus sp. PCC 7305]ELS05371.1 phosphoribosylglycinamide formyltransferase, formyltetrahydrofolate-dependent [Xenococcus sp. PCC 7305]